MTWIHEVDSIKECGPSMRANVDLVVAIKPSEKERKLLQQLYKCHLPLDANISVLDITLPNTPFLPMTALPLNSLGQFSIHAQP